ncbi:MAG TPA: tail fiber protein [Vicinamibacterales bacterium]
MADPFLGEIKILSFAFAPKGWALCNGQLLPINQNQALFALLGTMYGGNGQTNFALPDLRARTPIHFSPAIPQGSSGGADEVTLTEGELAAHGHLRATSNQATSASPVGNVLANAVRRGIAAFADPASPVVMVGAQSVGGGQPHDNRQPSLVLSFTIALVGIFPSFS